MSRGSLHPAVTREKTAGTTIAIPSRARQIGSSNEAAIKTKALYASRRSYILADESKFGVESNVRFADFKDAKVITTTAPDGEWKKQKNIIQVQ